MHLALLMGRTLDELGRTMTSAEFAEWLAYDRVHGLPDPWLQTALLGCEARRPWLKRGHRAEPLDLIPWRKGGGPRARMSPRQVRAAMARVPGVTRREPDGR